MDRRRKVVGACNKLHIIISVAVCGDIWSHDWLELQRESSQQRVGGWVPGAAIYDLVDGDIDGSVVCSQLFVIQFISALHYIDGAFHEIMSSVGLGLEGGGWLNRQAIIMNIHRGHISRLPWWSRLGREIMDCQSSVSSRAPGVFAYAYLLVTERFVSS